MLWAMGTAKWWVCGTCSSLNDLPAGKCYKCRAAKPADARLIDDTYSEVGAAKRVSVSVDRAMVSEIVRQDPIETQGGGGIMEAFEADEQVSASQPTIQPSGYDPYGGPSEVGPAERLARAGVPPLRDPTPRGIEQVGGRHWTDGLQPRTDRPAVPPPTVEPSEKE